MKSLITNLKHNPTQSHIHDLPQFRLDSKDGFAPDYCYSFGDHDTNLREKKEKNKTETKL